MMRGKQSFVSIKEGGIHVLNTLRVLANMCPSDEQTSERDVLCGTVNRGHQGPWDLSLHLYFEPCTWAISGGWEEEQNKNLKVFISPWTFCTSIIEMQRANKSVFTLYPPYFSSQLHPPHRKQIFV